MSDGRKRGEQRSKRGEQRRKRGEQRRREENSGGREEKNVLMKELQHRIKRWRRCRR